MKRSVTLVEFIIALAITAIIGGAATVYLRGSLDLEGKGRAQVTLSRQADLALMWLERDIREADYLIFTGPSKLELSKMQGNQRVSILYLFDDKTMTMKRQNQGLLNNLTKFEFSYRNLIGSRLPTDDPKSGIPQSRISGLRLINISFCAKSGNTSLDSIASIAKEGRILPVYNKDLPRYYLTIEEALGDVGLKDGQTIMVQAGTYRGYQIIRKNIILEGGYDRAFSRRNQKAIIEGGGYAIGIGAAGGDVTVDGFILRRGAWGGWAIAAGWEWPPAGNITFRNCIIKGNSGAVYAGPLLQRLRFINCEITGNSFDGGGHPIIYSRNAGFDFLNCSIAGNYTTHSFLIEVFSDQPRAFSITNSKITGNGMGGSNRIMMGFNFTESGNSSLAIKNSQVNGNYLGGTTLLKILNPGSLIFSNSEFKNNRCSMWPPENNLGIISVSNPGTFSLTNCDVVKNSLRGLVNLSGIIYLNDQAGSGNADAFTIDRCRIESNELVFYGNTGSGNGIIGIELNTPGAASPKYSIQNTLFTGNEMNFSRFTGPENSNGIIKIKLEGTGTIGPVFSVTNSTLAKNIISDANLMYLQGGAAGRTKRLLNNILYHNTLNPADPYLNGTDDVIINYCDRERESIGRLGLDPRSGNNITLDPQFVDVDAGDFHLKPGSPCINAGDPDAIYNDADGSRNDMGVYGGPGGQEIGFKAPTVDDPATPDIREDVIGTY